MIKKKCITFKRGFCYFLSIVVLECVFGHYGYNCNETCGHCKDAIQCSTVSGTCLTGCKAGYVGRLCKEGGWFVCLFIYNKNKKEVIWFFVSLTKQLFKVFSEIRKKICLILFEF